MYKKFLFQGLTLLLFIVFAVASSESTYSNTHDTESSSSTSSSFLSPASFPTTSSDYSFTDRTENAANGYR